MVFKEASNLFYKIREDNKNTKDGGTVCEMGLFENNPKAIFGAALKHGFRRCKMPAIWTC